MKDFATLVKEMLEFGFTQTQIEDVLTAHQDEIQTKIFSDFIDNNTEEKLEEVKTKFEKATTPDEKANVLEEVTVLAYGDKAQSKREEIMAEILNAALEMAKKIRDLYQKYLAGDPEAVSAVQKAMQSPDYSVVESLAKANQ